MSEALLRSAIVDLKCLRDAMVRRGPFINRTLTATDRFLCRMIVGILNSAIPALEAIQKMDRGQRVQAHALSFVLTLEYKIKHYIDSRYGPLRNPGASEPIKALMATDIERLLSALSNIGYVLEKMEVSAVLKTTTAAAPASASIEFNPLSLLTLWYYILSARAAFLIAANAPQGKASPAESPEAPATAAFAHAGRTRTGGPTLTCFDGDRTSGAPPTPRPAEAPALRLCR